MTKDIIIYIGNIVIALAVIGLVVHHDITWPMAATFIGIMLTPSAVHTAAQRIVEK